MVLLLERLNHEMIWLPDGGEGSDREKQMIQSPKSMPTFVWNPHGFQVVDAMPCHTKRRDVHGRLLYLKYSHRDHCSAWREVKGGWSCMRRKARPHAANVTRAFCDDYALRIAPHPPYSPDFALSDFSLVSCWEISKSASEDSNSGLQMNFSRSPNKFWMKSVLTLWKRCSGSGSTDWTDAFLHCSK
jgi:hypothetical protein